MDWERRCGKILDNGKKCPAYKLKNGELCFKHSQTALERSLMAQQGGLSGKIITGLGRRIEIQKPRHIRKALVNTLNLLKEGQIEPNIANSIAYICGVIIKNFELIEMDERLKEIENKLGLKPKENEGGELDEKAKP